LILKRSATALLLALSPSGGWQLISFKLRNGNRHVKLLTEPGLMDAIVPQGFNKPAQAASGQGALW
jgi:hypothetical protein